MTVMLSRRGLLGGALAATLLPKRLPAQPPSSGLEALIARNTEARGGAAALDRVHACLIELDINERGQTIRGRYAAHEDGLVRIDIFVGGNLVYREGVDRAGVWQWPGDAAAPSPSNADGAANALLHGAENHLFGLHRFRERGHQLRLMPSERIDSIEYPVIEIVYSTGHKSYFYVDPATWLFARRRDERAYHPDVDTTRQRVETRYLDYQAVDGVVAAHRNLDIDLDTGAVLSTNQVTRRTLNPVLLPTNLFDRGYRRG